MDVHLIDGTYELFRHFYAVPAAQDVKEREIGAVRAVLRSVLSMIERGATHIGVGILQMLTGKWITQAVSVAATLGIADLLRDLFDLPPVVKGAQAAIAAAGLSDRCETVAGDIFDSVPSGADAYMMKSIIHGFNEARAGDPGEYSSQHPASRPAAAGAAFEGQGKADASRCSA